MNDQELAEAEATVDLALGQAGGEQLRPGREAVLPDGDPGDDDVGWFHGPKPTTGV